MIQSFLNEIKVNLKPAQKDESILQNLSSFSMINADEEYDQEDELLVEIVADEKTDRDLKIMKQHERGWLGNKNCFEKIHKEIN